MNKKIITITPRTCFKVLGFWLEGNGVKCQIIEEEETVTIEFPTKERLVFEKDLTKYGRFLDLIIDSDSKTVSLSSKFGTWNVGARYTYADTQCDPFGKNQHESGAKMDYGKLQPSLIITDMAPALNAVIEVGTYGAMKYTPQGWLHVPDGEKRYTDAMLRHLLQETTEDYDTESGLLHASHLAWNALARLHWIIERIKNNGNSTTTNQTTTPERSTTTS